MAGFDLHTHTTCSDGTTAPAANVRLAVELGLEGIALTDHDTAEGVAETLDAATGTGLQVVVGTELSAELDGLSVHVLGYWIDPAHPPLAAEMARLRDERADRALRMVERLRALGVDVRFERVAELAAGAPIGRPHVAEAVVEAGAASDLREVFERFLADGGPAYVEKHALDPASAVRLVVAAGGVAVLAHPGLYGDRASHGGVPDDEIERMAAAGLAGVEAAHPDHTPDRRDHYTRLAAGLGLEVTAGSDYHGDHKTNRLGSAVTDRGTVERLAARRVVRPEGRERHFSARGELPVRSADARTDTLG